MGYCPKKNDLQISNVVISGQTEKIPDLTKVTNPNLNIIFNPKMPHKILIKNKNPKFTLTIFGSGKFLGFVTDIITIKKIEETVQSIL